MNLARLVNHLFNILSKANTFKFLQGSLISKNSSKKLKILIKFI